MSDQEHEFLKQLKRWGIALVIFMLSGMSGLVGYGFNFIREQNAVNEVKNIQIETMQGMMDQKVSNAVLLEFIRYYDKILEYRKEGCDKNAEAIKELSKEFKDFQLKYFSQNNMRGVIDSSLYLPYYYSYAIDNDIGLY